LKNHKLENKIRKDTATVKKDIKTMIKDGEARVSRFEQDLSRAKVDLSTWVEDGVSQLGDGFEKLTGDARETLVDAVAMVKKDVGQGLKQYDAKAQDVAKKVSGNFAKKVSRYPWASISIALGLGLLMGGLILRPTRQSIR
jgi:ElaB/YqjD/DUF883 family membrane-anchored ribosome-binding protein